MHIRFIFWISILCASTLVAQLPKTDLYLAEFKGLSAVPQLLKIKYLNDFNPNGYNNQPGFFTFDELFLTVGKDTSNTTEIYHLNLKSAEYFRFTETPGISEFSATSSMQKGKISCVRIEPDGKDQSLWSYPADRSGMGSRLLPNLKNIGYYAWLNKDSVALFLVGNPHTLVIADVNTGKTDFIIDNIGRCIKYDNEGRLFFVHKVKSDLWQLKSLDIQNRNTKVICTMPPGREDYDLLINGNIIAGDGSKLKTINPAKSTEWVEIADFSNLGINNINRLVAVRDRVVFVNNK